MNLRTAIRSFFATGELAHHRIEPNTDMSDVKFSCPHCGQRLRCDQRHSGRRILCPKCERPMAIPTHPGLPIDGGSEIQAEPRAILAPRETLPPASSSHSIGSAK